MKIELKENKSWKKMTAISLFVMLVSYAAYAVTTTSGKSVSLTSLRFQNVESGKLDIYTSAYGELVSAKERLLTAPAMGKVSEILVRPGTKITPEMVILRLSNPKLEQEVSEARGQLAQQQAQREAYKYEQQNERLNYQSRIADIEANIEKAQLELKIQLDLMSLGVASKIELERAKLALKQEKKRLQFEQQKYEQFTEMQGYQLTQRDITVTQQLSQVSLLEKQLDDMQVKAGITGALQTLEIELGESVQQGQSLAKVGSNELLIARLRLPQHQADQIDINAAVILDTQKGKIAAHITRIESVVTNGSVLAEAALDGELTSNARPSLAISAKVFVKQEQNATYMAQISGVRPGTKQTLFVQAGEDILERRDVVLGELTQGKLLIVAGLSKGDKVVSTDTDDYSQYKQISLTQ